MADSNQSVHFPVGNGDMTLLQVGAKGAGRTILIDMRINGTCEPNKCDVLKELHSHLPKNNRNIPYVDLLVITHPDDDHCAGFDKHFYSGDPDNYVFSEEPEYQPVIANEIWFSEICTRRISKNHRLSPSAVSLRTELKRRRKLHESGTRNSVNGNRLKTVGAVDHPDDKSERWDLPGMVIERGSVVWMGDAQALILAPFEGSFFDEAHQESKNNSSIIARWTVNGSDVLVGGDATAYIWHQVDQNYTDEQLSYDLLLAPHHCSWRSLSLDSSQSDNPRVLDEAKRALSHTRDGAYIVSSSKKIKHDDSDPPSARAMVEYQDILEGKDRFLCLADSGTDTHPPVPKLFALTQTGVSPILASANTSAIPRESKPIRHG